ncbi:GFA family protein [Lichenicola sp.]|uniref:GFA family protein n=1 Tax=Lichenicola sp. TaxID=2804529 RepID=UPI003AFFA971
MMLTGSCACGHVRYEIKGDLVGPVTYCHCWRCRKHSGSSFGTTAGVRAADFTILTGQALISSWESSPGVHRCFARCCGSPLYKRDEANPYELGFRLGTLDVDPLRKADIHFMVGSKAPWVEIRDDLPQAAGGSPFGLRDELARDAAGGGPASKPRRRRTGKAPVHR